jgi:hypothetical protein
MIVEKDDAFEVRETGLVVTVGRTEGEALLLELDSPGVKWTVRIEGSCSLEGRPDDLIGERVVSVRARKSDGQLDVMFANGSILTVYPDLQYEPWEMHSSRGGRLIAVPGGGIAMWGAES